MQKRTFQKSSNGFSMIELLTVVTIIGIATAIVVPQMVAQRRLTRTHGLIRQIAAQMRNARQLAMSERHAFTLQYDDVNKQMVLIDNCNRLILCDPVIETSQLVLTDASYPHNTGSAVVTTIPLTTGGLAASELTFGIPAGLPTGALDDGIAKTNLNASNQFNITFQPDGSVIDANGNFASSSLFLHNNKAVLGTASAISIIGATGRVKIWRYDPNVTKYAE